MGRLKPQDRFDVQRMHRSKLIPHPKNPRTIDPAARAELMKSVREFGMVEPPVWNKRSNYLCGGHQRLSCLDEINGTTDYELNVSVVDLDEQREAVLLVKLNSEGAQGAWDFGKLDELMRMEGLSPADFAFGDMELAVFMGREDDSPLERKDDSAKMDQDEINGLRERRQNARDRTAELDGSEFYFVLAALTRERIDAVMDALGLDKTTRYHDGIKLVAALKARGFQPVKELPDEPVNPETLSGAELAARRKERKAQRRTHPGNPGRE